MGSVVCSEEEDLTDCRKEGMGSLSPKPDVPHQDRAGRCAITFPKFTAKEHFANERQVAGA